jgi:hypothetical protein
MPCLTVHVVVNAAWFGHWFVWAEQASSLTRTMEEAHPISETLFSSFSFTRGWTKSQNPPIPSVIHRHQKPGNRPYPLFHTFCYCSQLHQGLIGMNKWQRTEPFWLKMELPSTYQTTDNSARNWTTYQLHSQREDSVGLLEPSCSVNFPPIKGYLFNYCIFGHYPPPYLLFKAMFRQLNPVSVFRRKLLNWAKETDTSSDCWAQMSNFHLNTETEASFRNDVF